MIFFFDFFLQRRHNLYWKYDAVYLFLLPKRAPKALKIFWTMRGACASSGASSSHGRRQRDWRWFIAPRPAATFRNALETEAIDLAPRASAKRSALPRCRLLYVGTQQRDSFLFSFPPLPAHFLKVRAYRTRCMQRNLIIYHAVLNFNPACHTSWLKFW